MNSGINEKIDHTFLVQAENVKFAKAQVKKFLLAYQLVRYDKFEICHEGILHVTDDTFLTSLDQGLQRNVKVLRDLIDEIKSEGYLHLDDLQSLPQGYLSKLMHLIVHILDGFFGIDSYFYNLIEGSHFVSHSLKMKLIQGDGNYFLVPVKAYILERVHAFELLSPKKFLKL